MYIRQRSSGIDLPREMARWSLTTLREKLVNIGAQLVRHARQIIFQMAEAAVSKGLFGEILQRIWALAPGAG